MLYIACYEPPSLAHMAADMSSLIVSIITTAADELYVSCSTEREYRIDSISTLF